MTTTRAKLVALCLAVVLLAGTGCGSATTISSGAAGLASQDFSVCDDTDVLVALLRTGLPTYDYDPSSDLATLIDNSDVVVAGVLASAVRDGETTLLRAAEASVLSATDDASADRFNATHSFVIDSVWASAEPDPLGAEVAFEPERTRFIAFLNADGAAGRFAVAVEGLHVSCGDPEPAKSVIAELPSETSGSVEEITAAVLAVVDPSSAGTEPIPTDRAGELAFGLQRCDHDAARMVADPTFYRDEPIYVGNEQPTEQVRTWAQNRPGYEDIWIDRDHNGWISVGFSQDAAIRQAELEAEFPGVGVVAVKVPATEAELRALRADVEAALQGLPSWGSGHSVSRGLVEISVPVLDDGTLARFAPFAGSRLCVDGLDPVDAVPDGDQPTEGEGWRLLGNDLTGASYRTGIATTADQYRQLWNQAGLSGELPAVDFTSEVVIWFGAVFGSSCPIRMDDVVFDLDQHLVHGKFVRPGNPTSCTDDANAEAYVVAVARDRLPDAPFAVQLNDTDPPRGVPEERTTVNVDLRPAGAILQPTDLVVESLDTSPPAPERFAPGFTIEDGFPWTLLIDLDCSVDVIGPLNATMWRSTDPDLINGAPLAWEEAAIDRMAEAEFLLTTGPPSLTITINGVAVTYDAVPATEEADMSCT